MRGILQVIRLHCIFRTSTSELSKGLSMFFNSKVCIAWVCLLLTVSSVFAQDKKKPKMVRVPTAGNKVVKVDESKEPPIFFDLNINGKSYKGKVGESVKLSGTFKDANATIKLSKFRTFDYAGVSFSYPEKLVWKTDLTDPTSKGWTMTGVTGSINVFDVEGADYTAAAYSKVLIDDFDTDDFDEEDLTIELGGKKYEGIRLIFEFGEEKFVYDIVQLPSRKDRSRLLLLEEVAPDLKPDNEEGKQILELLKKSFKIEK